MIIHLCKDTLESLWPLMVSGLKRPLENTSLGEFWDMESLYSRLQVGLLLGFYQESSGYSGIYSLNQAPKALELRFFWSGKDPLNETPIDFQEVNEYLQKAATLAPVVAGIELMSIGICGTFNWEASVGTVDIPIDAILEGP